MTHNDQGGSSPPGFQRIITPPHILEIDPATIGQAGYLFEHHAVGTVSTKQMAAETGLEAMRIQQILLSGS